MKKDIEKLLINARWNAEVTILVLAECDIKSYQEIKSKKFALGPDSPNIFPFLSTKEQFIILNELIHKNSSNTCITFIPFETSPMAEDEQFLKDLAILSTNLPPTLLVQAIHSVMSTEL